MKVSFTTKEYARLLELVHLGLSVAGARVEDPGSTPDRYEDIAQKVYGLAETFGCGELVERDVNGELFPNEQLTEGAVEKKLTEFVDDVFWSELVARLSQRDLRHEIGDSTAETDELPREQLDRLEVIEDAYWREFETHGVDHLQLLRGGLG